MRPQKPITGTCQLVIDFDSQTGTFLKCGNHITGQGRWLYCSNEHRELARKDYKAIRNAIDLRLSRFRLNLLTPLNSSLITHYDPSALIEVGWMLDTDSARLDQAVHDNRVYGYIRVGGAPLSSDSLEEYPFSSPLPTSLGMVHYQYHEQLKQLREEIQLSILPDLESIARKPCWLEGLCRWSVRAALFDGVTDLTSDIQTGKALSPLSIRILSDRETLSLLYRCDKEARAISRMMVSSLSVLASTHLEAYQNGNQCALLDTLCTQQVKVVIKYCK